MLGEGVEHVEGALNSGAGTASKVAGDKEEELQLSPVDKALQNELVNPSHLHFNTFLCVKNGEVIKLSLSCRSLAKC